MPVIFKSQATGDVLMLNAHAETLLQLLGKTAEEPGILETKDMPAALKTLKGLSDEPVQDDATDTPDDPDDDVDKKREPAFADEHVSLRKRAWPLVQMIERAQAEGKPIVWGV